MNNTSYDKTSKLVGIRIKYKRKENNLTQEKLSELMGISTGQLSCIERGIYLPTTQNIYKICDILGEDPNYYLIGSINPERQSNINDLIKILPDNYQKVVEQSIKLLVDTYSKEQENLTKN